MNGTSLGTTTGPPAAQKRRARRNTLQPVGVPQASPQARRQAVLILEVFAGVRLPSDAAQVLGTSLARYYQLERRALAGLLAACEPAQRGPRTDTARRVRCLEKQVAHLERECGRQQALVRAAQRSLGLSAPQAVKPVAKGDERASNGKKRRQRRPTVRALRMAAALQAAEPQEAGRLAESGPTVANGTAQE